MYIQIIEIYTNNRDLYQFLLPVKPISACYTDLQTALTVIYITVLRKLYNIVVGYNNKCIITQTHSLKA